MTFSYHLSAGYLVAYSKKGMMFLTGFLCFGRRKVIEEESVTRTVLMLLFKVQFNYTLKPQSALL